MADLINLAQNLDCYEFYPGVEDDETLGRIYVEDMEAIDVPEHLLNYFDYEAYGRDIRLEEDGHFAPGGYVLNNGGQFIEHYHGIEDIPDEHKVFAFPQLTVREHMSQEQKIAFDNSVKGDPREERNIPQSRETAFDEITKSAAQQGLAKLPNLPDQRWRKRKCQKKRKMMFNR